MTLVSSFHRLAISRPVQQCRTFVAARQLRPKRFTSVLENVPPKPRSGWQIFCRENLKDYKGPDGKTSIIEANRALSVKWRSLSESDKEHYNDIFRKEAAVHQEAYDRALQNATPQQLYDENQLRKKYKLKELKDPKAPKRPSLGGYMYYLVELRKNDSSFNSLPLMEQSKEASKRYKALSDQEKKPYIQQAEAAKQKYLEDKENYNAQIKKK
ncbi:HMG-box [Lichtheimia hyalospora FSU 10163]|nr:HMG-box [Lichtheimia hyalospora FSU 10163]